jgi:Uma2 family endonuclease
MTQAISKFLTFEDYLSFNDGTENRYELVDGVLVELPPESEPNISTANYLFLLLVKAGIPFRLVHPHACELQVPVIYPGDPSNRFPDLVVLRDAHLQLTQRRLTITLDMPPPQLVVEVVSPGPKNWERDYKNKLAQYQARTIDEYWIVDPEAQAVTVFSLRSGQYFEAGRFRGSDRITSPLFPNLAITAAEILQTGSPENE